jgi:hypothetical protein
MKTDKDDPNPLRRSLEPQREFGNEMPELVENGWSTARSLVRPAEKDLMAGWFVDHEFLVPEGANPEGQRETVASILVNAGTTPNIVVERALAWVDENTKHRGPFFLNWYTPGHLIPTAMREYRERSKHMQSATRLFLFPGQVDAETQSVSGPDAEAFVEGVQRVFSYSFLSGHAFDISTGNLYFHWPAELRLQRACATRRANHKFLFLDPDKFRFQGERAYSLADLLETSHAVTIITVATEVDRDRRLCDAFQRLAESLLRPTANSETDLQTSKILRLIVVGRNASPTTSLAASGFLNTS